MPAFQSSASIGRIAARTDAPNRADGRHCRQPGCMTMDANDVANQARQDAPGKEPDAIEPIQSIDPPHSDNPGGSTSASRVPRVGLVLLVALVVLIVDVSGPPFGVITAALQFFAFGSLIYGLFFTTRDWPYGAAVALFLGSIAAIYYVRNQPGLLVNPSQPPSPSMSTATPQPSQNPTATPTPMISPTASPTPTATPTPSPSPSPTPTPGPVTVDDFVQDFESGSFNQTTGNSGGWHEIEDVGWLGHTWWTQPEPGGAIDRASWTPNLPKAGVWQVSAYIPRLPGGTKSNRAEYHVCHFGQDFQVTIDQTLTDEDWTPLGPPLDFPAGAGGSGALVVVTDHSGRHQKTTHLIMVDAVKWEWVGPSGSVDHGQPNEICTNPLPESPAAAAQEMKAIDTSLPIVDVPPRPRPQGFRLWRRRRATSNGHG